MAEQKKPVTPDVKPEGIPDGYKSTKRDDGERHDIVRLEEGQFIEGYYYGTKILPSNYSADGSVLWQIKCLDGEIRLLNERTTMKDIRLSQLREGMAVLVINNGEKQGKKNTYKDFEVFIKD